MKKRFYNPIIISEIKIRMRNWRTPMMLGIYLTILLTISFITYNSLYLDTTRIEPWESYEIGKYMYVVLATFQFLLIFLITPAQTSGSISGEREKQTFDLLLCTKMSPLRIIIGKLISSMSFILLLIIASIPIFSLVFVFGGITPGNIITLFAFYLITALLMGSIGIFWSSVFNKSSVSTVMSYLSVFLLSVLSIAIGGIMIYAFYRPYIDLDISEVPRLYTPFIYLFNPIMGLVDILMEQYSPGEAKGVIDVMVRIFGDHYDLESVREGGTFISRTWMQMGFWLKNSIVMLLISGVLICVSVWNINPLRRKYREKQKQKLDEGAKENEKDSFLIPGQ